MTGLEKIFVNRLKTLGIETLDVNMGQLWSITLDLDNCGILLAHLAPGQPLEKAYKVDRVESDRELLSSKEYELLYGDKEVFTVYGKIPAVI